VAGRVADAFRGAASRLRARGVRIAGPLLVAASLLAITGGEAGAIRLWDTAPAPPNFMPSPLATAHRAIVIDTTRLVNPADTVLVLGLPDGDSVRVVRTGLEARGSGRLVWFGHVDGDPLGDVTFSRVRRAVVGTVHPSDGRYFRIRYAGDGVSVIETIDSGRIPPGAEPRLIALGDSTGRPPCRDADPRRIDVMVVYTLNALAAAVGEDAMEAAVHEAIGQANTSYAESGIDLRLNLVHLASSSYEDEGYIHSDLDAVENGEDELAGTADLRELYGADVVVLVPRTSVTDEKGLSNVLIPASVDKWEQAYCVVPHEFLTLDMNFAHEIGHLQSARHDWATDSVRDAVHPANHGYVAERSTLPAYRTVMAEQTGCDALGITDAADCVRIGRWSDPDGSIDTDPLGSDAVGSETDNVATLNRTAGIVANFMCASPGRADAWMKDTWADTGKEPDPDLAAVPMWRSPSIWVRNAADPDLLFAHRHENPIRGRVNYAYVKIQGGDRDIAGTLRLYVANASLGLEWRADWTEIGDRTTTLVTDEMRIVEFAWTPGEAGHYCLAAAWDSDDDPMESDPEPVEMDLATRRNNNIVWRNVNVVELLAGDSTSATFRMRGVKGPFSLFVTVTPTVPFGRRRPDPEPLFVALRLDPRVLAAWRDVGAPGRGFRLRGGVVEIDTRQGAQLDGITVPGTRAVENEIVFASGRVRPRAPARYLVDVVQVVGAGRDARAGIGGIEYEVGVDRPVAGRRTR
jgi:hypothetical protein